MRIFFVFLFLIQLNSGVVAEEFRAKVITVIDGDTVLLVRQSNQPIKVRLVGIDAPEKAQEYGPESKASLLEMVLHKQVLVSSKALDDYGRLLAEISVGGLNVNQEQVRRGMAWDYSRFHGNHELAVLQHEAQQARRGLWASASAIEPSKWRKQHPSVWPVPAAASSTPVVADPASRLSSGKICSKKRCAEMTSCEEAKYYLAHCHVATLDGDRDGIPCESLCAPNPVLHYKRR